MAAPKPTGFGAVRAVSHPCGTLVDMAEDEITTPGSGGPREVAEGVDPLLDLVVTMSQPVAGIRVTLFVGGALITGEVISYKRWWSLMHRMLQDAGGSGTEALDIVLTGAAEPSEDDPPQLLGFRNIHLREVRVVGPTQMIFNNGLLRLQLSHVDGWILGSADVTEQL